MNWKEHLRALELNQQWDRAIKFMQGVIYANPDDMDAYIYMNFLLMNTLVEVDRDSYDVTNNDYYMALCKKYFDESYAKFSDNAEYLFCTATTAVFSEWYFGITIEDYEKMFLRAMELAPDNILYKRAYYMHLKMEIPSQRAELLAYGKLILDSNSPLIKEWQARGALGEYLQDCMKYGAKLDLAWEPLPQDPQSVWKRKLNSLEIRRDWGEATKLMQDTIAAYPDDMHAYIYTNFFLMNLLVNEDYNESFKEDNLDDYADLLEKYFNESYAKFSDNAEYLFCTGVIGTMEPAYLGLDIADVHKMLVRAIELELDNILYKSAEYLYLNRQTLNSSPAAIEYAQQALQRGSELYQKLNWHSSFNKYLSAAIQTWAKAVLHLES